MKEALVLMAKAPIEGRVKTRLAATLGPAEAAELYANFLRDIFFIMEVVQDEREGLSLVLCYAEEGDEEAFEEIEREGSLMLPQRGDDLGERLINCLDDLFDFGFESIVVIGGDSPTLPPDLIGAGFDALAGEADVALLPAIDDGYCLIGMKRTHRELFTGIPWSTPAVLDETRKRAAASSLELVELPPWYDVDSPDDLERLREELAEDRTVAANTRRCLRHLDKLRNNH
ncbi:MAG: TIGR04282 family arsenosugar biosynthesis glycosyltransferase [Blastocatellales bacterium]